MAETAKSQRFIKSCLAVAVLFFCYSAAADMPSVSEAYELVPHRQTPYIATDSQLHTEIATNLERLFRLSDRALVQKVAMLSWCKKGGTKDYSYASYADELMAVQEGIKKLDFPMQARPAVRALSEALALQSDYFKNWSAAIAAHKPFPEAFKAGSPLPPLVAQSKAKLTDAYRMMITAFPEESDRNKQAFADHLGALEFQ